MARSNFTAELCQHRNITVAVPGFSCPNLLTRPFDTETDSDPDPDLASPLTFSDDLELNPPEALGWSSALRWRGGPRAGTGGWRRRW
ncbi:MAG: hypothetical protein ACOX52_00645 [Verrucomicrobiota bacterium]